MRKDSSVFVTDHISLITNQKKFFSTIQPFIFPESDHLVKFISLRSNAVNAGICGVAKIVASGDTAYWVMHWAHWA